MSSVGKASHVEKQMGSGVYGVVVFATDQMSGERAIKLVTRVFEKLQLAKRTLWEITIPRHFSNHENIIGLIDVDTVYPNFQEMFVLFLWIVSEMLTYMADIFSWRFALSFLCSGSISPGSHSGFAPDNQVWSLLPMSTFNTFFIESFEDETANWRFGFGLSRGFDSTPDEHFSN
ncbi:hypothetical protein EDD15DRAFT_2375141 [Pisolithus albus]|nr:hypothetical protein EDD15DRAFT_2375141 [Pisolithus albus]